jgi:hypothetical protein
VVSPDDTYDVQLKGAGKTPYSRLQTVAQCCTRRCANSWRSHACSRRADHAR